MELFPELGLQETKFSTVPSISFFLFFYFFIFLFFCFFSLTFREVRYYSNIDNRRAFFDSFANEHGFDPLISENWQKINAYHLKDRKVLSALLFSSIVYLFNL
jgi:hypothetical protein